jgi:hypothetical protein
VATLLADAEILIKARIPDLDDQVEESDDFLEIVKYVEASAVVRLVRNPNGYTSETDGDYTYQINFRLASGELEITDKEWSLLGLGGGMFLINMKVPTPLEGGRYITDPENPLFFYAPMFWEPL